MPFFVVRLVLQDDLAVAIDRNPIVRVGQIFGRKPEIQRMFAHQIECPFRRHFRRAGFERLDRASRTESTCPMECRPTTSEPSARPFGCLSLAERKSNAAELIAPPD